MVPNGNAKAARGKHHPEKRDLKPVEPKMVEVNRDRGQGQGCRADEEGAGDPVDAVERQAQEEALGGRW